MKCPVCGQWNRASNPRCLKCGSFLTPPKGSQGEPTWQDQVKDGQRGTEYYRMDEYGVSDAKPDARDTLAREMADLKERKVKGARAQQTILSAAPLRRETGEMDIRESEGTSAYWRVTEGTAAERAGRRRRTPGEPVRRGGSRTAVEGDDPRYRDTRWDDSRAFDPLWAEQEAYAARWQMPAPVRAEARQPVRQRFFRKLLRALTALVALGVVGLCVFFGYHYFQERAAAQREERRATVVASMLEGLAAHTVMIPGEEGAQIYIRELHTSYVVSGGYATIEIADHTWYDELEHVRDETMDVTLTPFLKSASGRQVPLEEIRYTIDIPLSPIELTDPDGLRTEVSSAMYTMKFTVRPGSTVTVNGRDISDTVQAESGEVSYNATVQPSGDNVFTLVCRSQYCRENELTVVLYREPQEIPLDLAADTYTSTSLKYMEVNCTTLPGATVNILSPHSDLNITNLNTTGAFSFYAVFDHIGDNWIEISSSYPGKKPSLVRYKVYYLPSPDEYTRKAWPLYKAEDYAELVSNIRIRAERTQVYVLTGTLQYFISEKPQIAVFNTSTDGQSQPVVVQNVTKTSWVKGQFYRIYGDAYSSYNSMPWLMGRYTYTN